MILCYRIKINDSARKYQGKQNYLLFEGKRKRKRRRQWQIGEKTINHALNVTQFATFSHFKGDLQHVPSIVVGYRRITF